MFIAGIRTEIRNKMLESLVYEKRGTYHYEIHQSWILLDTNVYQTDIKVYINRSLFLRALNIFQTGTSTAVLHSVSPQSDLQT